MDRTTLNVSLRLSFTLSVALFFLLLPIVSPIWALCFLFFALVGTGNVYLLSRIFTNGFFTQDIRKKILIIATKLVFLYALIVLYCIFLPLDCFAMIAGLNFVFAVIVVCILVSEPGKRTLSSGKS